MNLTEKHRPKTESDFIGDPEILKSLEEYVANSIPTLLVGPPGIGKTTAVFVIARKLGYTVMESNASDERRKDELKDLKSRLHMKSFSKVLYFLDEVDGIENKSDKLNQDFLANIIKETEHPVVLTANFKFKVSANLQKVCKVIEMTPPKLGEVVQRMRTIAKLEGIDVTFEKVSGDVRASINAVFYNGTRLEKEINIFDKVNNVFKTGKKDEDVDLIWLLDNVHNFYRGKDLYQAIQILVLVANTGCKELLDCLPISRRGRANYPYFLKKLKVTNGYNRRV